MIEYEEFFANSYVIYIAGREEERLTFTLQHLQDHGIFANPFPGVDGYQLPDSVVDEYPLIANPNPNHSISPKSVKGALGCSLSHLNLQAYSEYEDPVAVFEDDVLLAPHFQPYLREALKHLPEDWDAAYLAARHAGSVEPVNDYWVRSNYHRSTLCYVLRYSAYQVYMESWNLRPQHSDVLPDHPVFEKLNTYCIRPSMVVQQWTKSTITGASYLAASLREDSWLADLSKAEYKRYILENSNPKYWPPSYKKTLQ